MWRRCTRQRARTATTTTLYQILHVMQSTRVGSYNKGSYTLVKSNHSCWVHPTLKHPEFDPLGVVDLESTRQQSLVGMYVAFRL
jgi:hypothetical protein